MAKNTYWNPYAETMSRDERREMQRTKLAAQLRRVLENSPFYRRKFAEAGFDAAKVSSLEDLAHVEHVNLVIGGASDRVLGAHLGSGGRHPAAHHEVQHMVSLFA